MKYINELTDNEKRALIENNDALANMVYDDMIENEMHFISEQLDHIRDGLRDYSIGAYNRNIIIVSDAIKFLDGLEQLQKIYCTLPDELTPEISRVLAARDRFYLMSYNNKNYDLLDAWIDKKSQYFADCITNYFSACLDPTRDDMINYFIEFYADERMDERYYINDAGKLCQTITKIIA
jgi:hypothetical protein